MREESGQDSGGILHLLIVRRWKRPNVNIRATTNEETILPLEHDEYKSVTSQRHEQHHNNIKMENTVMSPRIPTSRNLEQVVPKKEDSEFDRALDKIRNICPFCQKRFSSAQRVEEHVVNVHRKPFQCDMCKKTYHTAEGLDEHKVTHQPDYFFECEVCKVKYKSEGGLKRHQIRVHSDIEPQYVCEHCGRGYMLKFDLTHHVKRSHSSQLQICRFCGKEVKDVRSHEWRHQIHNRDLYQYPCHLCRRRFHHRSRLDKHLMLHERGFKCEDCGRDCRSNRQLMEHRRFKHGQLKIFTCILCQKTFPSSSNYYQHVLTHAGIRPYRCDVCEEDFTQRSSLKRHRKNHPGPLPPLQSTHPQIADLARNYLQKLQNNQIDKSLVLNTKS